MTRVSRRSWRLSPLTAAVRYGLGFTLIGAAGAALAQQDATEVETDTVVVSATALKVATPLVETPRAVSSVDREELETRNVQRLDESFRYRSGVLAGHYGADNNTDWFKVRGFDQSTYQDGLRIYRTGYYQWLPEPYGLDRVEVFKGPASILYGEAPSGGLINAVSKRPTAEQQGEIQLQVGNRHHRQFAVDTSGPATESGDVRYRLVGLYKERDGDLNDTENERYYFAPSLEWDISDDTQLTLLASFQKDDGVPVNPFKLSYGTVQDTPFGKVDPQTNYGAPSYDKDEHTQTAIGYEFRHFLDDTWKFEQDFRYSQLDLDLRSTYMMSGTGDGRTANRGHLQRDGEIDSFTIDNRMVGQWYTDRTENTLLFGVDYQDLSLDGKEFDSFGYDTVDIFDPPGSITPVSGDQLTRRQIDKEQLGLYLQNQLRIDNRWVLLGGVRYDSADVRNESELNAVTVDETQSATSWTGGVMYLADNGLSPYLSYTESFQPVAQTAASGAVFEEIEGEQWELGVKYAPSHWDGYVTAAVFDLEESNSFATSPAGYQSQEGEKTSTGFELEGVGYLTDALKLTAAYTYTDTRDADDNRAALIPRHMASAWMDYDFEGTALDGLRIGAGVRHVGESVDGSITVPDYTVGDAMASYEFGNQWTAQVNVNNVTDEEYVASCDFWCYYGESRSVIGSLSYRF
ncbi:MULTISPECIES: TonB-dependent siderophore receptor [Halomonas]|uniref:Ligand-gated channel n=1 Tax=Halomonas halophila TaxID=29573 RepID=A0ABQ0U5E8_9GAMM|nr:MULTISPECIES: TonB-dependent siderophore receptor [Halomonas]MDR5890315.1 TonB-dependent siderophore receptor [Halomonas salina]WJY08192.1 TonB-dependent siderophore receptor [Halomonas halophila]GEK73763.1 ligand-gated channel [Halomonas halophila]